jgi:hypothetical protein
MSPAREGLDGGGVFASCEEGCGGSPCRYELKEKHGGVESFEIWMASDEGGDDRKRCL